MSAVNLFAQNKGTLHGRVLDSENNPVPFTYILIQSHNLATTTDINGNYTLDHIPVGTHSVTAQNIGYIPQEKSISIGDNTTLNFSLEESTQQLDEVQIIGKAEATIIREQSYAVSSIDTKPLQNLNLDVNQVLGRVSGVRIRETGGLGSRFDFSLNGFNGNQVRFFLDGIPMENFGSSLSLNNLPINIAKRIEIYKGVVPVWLGSDALGGAINIVTNSDKSNYLDVSYSYGSFNTHRPSISGGYTDKKSGFTVRANLFQNYSDNNYKVSVQKKEGTVILKEKEEVERFHDAYDSKSAMVDIGVVNKPFADQLLLGFVYSKSDKEQQTGATMEKVYGQRKRISSTVMPTFRYKKSNLLTEGLELNAFASYNFGYTHTIDTAARTYFWDGSYIDKADPTAGELNRTLYKFKDNAFIARANLSYIIDHNHSVVVNYTTNRVDRKGSDDANPLEISNQEPKIINKSVIGAGYKFDLKNKFTLSIFGKGYNIGGKTHYTENIYNNPERVTRDLQDFYTGYGTALSYRFPKIQLKASLEKAYRIPESDEFFGDGANLQENALLEPESSMNYNLGAIYSDFIAQNHQVSIEANLLRREVENFIRLNAGELQAQFINEDAVNIHGIEGNISYIYKSFLRVSANATYQKYMNDKAVGQGYSRQVPNKPVLFANANVMLNFTNLKYVGDKLGIGYSTSYFQEYLLFYEGPGSDDSKNSIPTQFSHDVDLNYSLKNGTYNISLSCKNIFDAELYDNFKLQKPGRAYYLKLRYFLQKF